MGNSRELVNKISILKNKLQSCEFELHVRISLDVFTDYIFNEHSIAKSAGNGLIKLGNKIFNVDDLAKDLKKLLDPKSFDIFSPEYEKCEYLKGKIDEAKREIMAEFNKRHPGANEKMMYETFDKFISENGFRSFQEKFNGFERYLKDSLR